MSTRRDPDRPLDVGEQVQMAFHLATEGHLDLEPLAVARARMAACPHDRVTWEVIPNGYWAHLCGACGAYWVSARDPGAGVGR